MSGTTGAPAAAPAQTSAATSGQAAAPILTGQAPPTPSFLETLPADIRGEAAFRDIKDVGALAKGYLHAQKLVGRDPATMVVLPEKADDAVAWSAVYDRLGRPAAPDGYKLSDVQGFTADPGLRGQYLDAAHKAGLSSAQADALYQWFGSADVSRNQAAQTQQAAERAAGVEKLRGEWGQAFEQKAQEARTAVRHYGGDDLVAYLDRAGLADDPVLARVFQKIGATLSEAKIVGSEGGSRNFSPAEAQSQIASLQADKGFMAAYLDRRNPGHADAMARMTALYQARGAPA